MNVLVPVDLSPIADNVCAIAERLKKEFEDQVRPLIPLGYVLASDGEYVVVTTTDGLYENSPFLSNNIAYKSFKMGHITIPNSVKPQDIYKMSGLLQILAGVDMEPFGKFCFKNEELK